MPVNPTNPGAAGVTPCDARHNPKGWVPLEPCDCEAVRDEPEPLRLGSSGVT